MEINYTIDMSSQEENEKKYFLDSPKLAERIKNDTLNFSEEKQIFILGNTLKSKIAFINKIIDLSLEGKFDTLYINDEEGFGFITFIKHKDNVEIFFGFHESRDISIAKRMLFKAMNIMKNKYDCNKFWFSFCPRKNFMTYKKFVTLYLGFSENEEEKRFEIEI